ncbi:RHS repeat-associated core domain-containing protein [Morganella morganii]|uniref:RHS repeat-associated core domain-containing protein n=1 Tax=Morganella morganii TaxID=582 RepID=UPI002023A057|nr:RHS repeat-associated core domain-containing protein [Morganella morganii]
MSKTENTLHKKTPSVTVLSNRGQVVRDIVYHRHPDTPEKTDERITYHQFDKRGFLEKSADPRMQASGLSNFRYVTSLSGQVLCTESADAGISLTLNDAAGRLMISISQICTDKGQDNCSKAVTQTFRYEGADSAGRLLSITEQTAGQDAQVTERFMYAGNSEAEKAKNLAGVCTHHYDPAGLMQTDSIALTGVPLSITRQLLKDADKPVSWPESNPQTLLSAEKYTTQTIADATGAVLKTLADTPEKVEALFTPGGQQTKFQPGQTLSWTARGELQQVTPVVRNGAAGDRESYRYDAGSQRILKTTVQETGSRTQTQQVIYLPGLELHSGKENYQVICAGVAGRAQVRLLHWQDGKKDHQRFSYDNLIGSSGLETDGDGNLLSQEEYYPFGGTAVLVADADSGIDYKTHRYSGKERDATGLYYYGYRYYQPWAGRWLSSDPAGTVDGLNLYSMVRNNPVSFSDEQGLVAYPRTQIPGTSLYQPGISTGSDREIRGAKLIPPAANTVTELFKGEPVRLDDVLADSTLQQTPLLTDLINPAKVKMDSSTRSSLSAVKGGIMEFNAVHIPAGNNGINALRIIDTETSAFQRGKGTTLAYWVPQGGYADIPAHPENGQPQLVFTPGFSGCSFVADKLDDMTIRVRHVQGGKEDAEYNRLHASEHGHGMIGAMEYRDYGYHENYSGAVLENIQGSAFMKYEGDSWQIKYQRLKNAPGIVSMGEKTSGIVRKQQGLKLEIRHSRERSVVGTGSVPLMH